jgi:hypothetical protein
MSCKATRDLANGGLGWYAAGETRLLARYPATLDIQCHKCGVNLGRVAEDLLIAVRFISESKPVGQGIRENFFISALIAGPCPLGILH